MAEKTISDLIADLLANMSSVSEKGTALVRTFQEQAAALSEMKAAAESASESLKGLGGIASANEWTGTGAWDGISKLDMSSMVGASLGNSSNAVTTQAQAAIDSGSATTMQNAINSMLNQVQGTQKLIDSAKIQYDAAMAAGNTQKANNIKQTSIDVNEKYIAAIEAQMSRIGTAMDAPPTNASGGTAKTYRLELKYNNGTQAGGTQYIDVSSYEQAQALIKSLGNAARLV